MSITTVDFIVEAFIAKRHGWSVAEQFLDTFNGETFEKQNYNALLYIRDTTRDVINSNILNDDSEAALQRYADELEDYIVGGGDEDDDIQDNDEDEYDGASWDMQSK